MSNLTPHNPFEQMTDDELNYLYNELKSGRKDHGSRLAEIEKHYLVHIDSMFGLSMKLDLMSVIAKRWHLEYEKSK